MSEQQPEPDTRQYVVCWHCFKKNYFLPEMGYPEKITCLEDLPAESQCQNETCRERFSPRHYFSWRADRLVFRAELGLTTPWTFSDEKYALLASRIALRGGRSWY